MHSPRKRTSYLVCQFCPILTCCIVDSQQTYCLSSILIPDFVLFSVNAVVRLQWRCSGSVLRAHGVLRAAPMTLIVHLSTIVCGFIFTTRQYLCLNNCVVIFCVLLMVLVVVIIMTFQMIYF